MIYVFLLGAEGGLEGAGAAGLQALMGSALKLDVLYAALLTELSLGGAATLGIDDEDVGLDEVERGKEVDDSPTLVDIGFLDGLDVLDHEEALFLGKHGLAVLILQVGGIGTDTYIELAKLRGLLEELYMTAMKKVIATRNEDFFHIIFSTIHFTIYLTSSSLTHGPEGRHNPFLKRSSLTPLT